MTSPAADLDHLPPLPRDRSPGIGCIGAGFIMADCHLPAYRAHGLNPVAIAARTEAAAAAVAARHGIPRAYGDFRHLLDDPAVEVLDVAVPPDVQPAVIAEALRRAGHGVQVSDPRERALALELLRFGEVLEDVEADSRPNVLTAWLYDLAGCYSTFYDSLSVLKAEGAERDSRLALCDLTGRVLRRGLDLLGIGTVEKM